MFASKDSLYQDSVARSTSTAKNAPHLLSTQKSIPRDWEWSLVPLSTQQVELPASKVAVSKSMHVQRALVSRRLLLHSAESGGELRMQASHSSKLAPP